MTERHVLFGLSGGVSVFALSGAFWYGLGVSSLLTDKSDWGLWAGSTLLQVGTLAGFLWAAFRMRRRSQLSRSDFGKGDELQRAVSRRLRIGFGRATAGEALFVGVGVWWFVHTDATALIWPWIGLIVSLHLIPLARLFHVRVYNVTALAGSVISLVGFTDLLSPYQLVGLTAGMATVMWFSAAYIVWKADLISSIAARAPWAA